LRATSDEAWSRAAAAAGSALGEIAEELSGGHFDDQSKRAPASLDAPDAFFLLTPEYRVEVEWFRNNGASGVFAELVRPQDDRLPLFLEQAVRRLTASWNLSRIGTCVSRMSRPIHGLAMRVVPMVHGDVRVGVFLNLYENGRETDETVSTFRISARERDVLYALLDGRSIAEIAESLNLAESTVNDHVARMIAKTKARNRIQMAATLLGWPARKPRFLKSGNGTSNGARSPETDDPEGSEDGERRRPRPSWRYHIGSGGPLSSTDWLP
jgi:DNA-binding CsgD family transcriptional regulator